jgi:hypothetical protein
MKAIYVFFVGGFVVAMLALFAAFVSAIGEAFVGYTVVNQSEQAVITWYQEDDCDDPIRYKEDLVSLAGEVRVPPGQSIEYSSTTQTTGCIRVVSEERLPLVTQKYSDDAVVTISEISPLSNDRVPLASELPEEPTGVTGHLREITVILLLVSAGAVLVSVCSGVVIVARKTLRLENHPR